MTQSPDPLFFPQVGIILPNSKPQRSNHMVGLSGTGSFYPESSRLFKLSKNPPLESSHQHILSGNMINNKDSPITGGIPEFQRVLLRNWGQRPNTLLYRLSTRTWPLQVTWASLQHGSVVLRINVLREREPIETILPFMTQPWK